MTSIALLATVAGSIVAGACAMADGALIVGEEEPPSTDARRRPASLARAHRALALTRTIALLAAGFGGALLILSLRLPAWSWIFLPAIALVAGAIAESHARAFGDRGRSSSLVRWTTYLADRMLGPLADVVMRLDVRAGALARDDDASAAAWETREPLDTPSTAGYTQDPARSSGIFELAETSVQDVMVPRVEIVGVDAESPWSEVVDKVRSSGHARVPVYRETIDDITGILYAKDLLAPVIDESPPEPGWQGLVRDAVVVPTTKSIASQLRDFQLSRTHIALVVDEYGGTAGIITIEDILEEIVGEIRDERDDEEPPVEQEEGRCYWVPGRYPLADLEELLCHRFGDDDSATVGGLVYSRLGRVPRSGEEITIDTFRVVIERVVRRRIERVYFERLPTAAESAGS
jgi:putative hemolysin